ncbi:GAF domain-containing protein [Candidatus Manganitrophus noduliformans]|uniref:GAF domain-containing protein n=1 Tax=Candidatus Manganitrophus noduliformans TaxID=2606439 RepID=UPI00143903C2|nr:GAF domain-containing protein [Candidatus Manganitrophus noduliformans]
MNILSEESFVDFTRLAAHTCETPIAFIHFIKDNRHAIKSVVGWESQLELSGLPFFSHTILRHDVFVVQDASVVDERFSDHPLVMSGPQIRFYAGAPMIHVHEQVVGTLSVMSSSLRAFSQYQIESLRMLALQVVGRVGEEHLKIARLLGLELAIIVPLLARGRTLGAISLYRPIRAAAMSGGSGSCGGSGLVGWDCTSVSCNHLNREKKICRTKTKPTSLHFLPLLPMRSLR